MKVFLIGGIAGDPEHELLVAAVSAQDAYNHWLAYFADWDKPGKVRVYEIVTPVDAGVIMWGTLPHTAFEVPNA